MSKTEQLAAVAERLSEEQVDALLSLAHSMVDEPFYDKAPPEALASLERGLEQIARGETVSPGRAFQAARRSGQACRSMNVVSRDVQGRRRKAMKKRVGILISGRGSNMMALIEAARAADYPAEVAVVVSNRPEAPGLERARAAGIKALAIDHKGFATREEFDDAVERALQEEGADLVCHAGLHAHSEHRVRHPLAGAAAQHPSLAAAVLQGAAPAAAGARCRRADCRLHGAFRHARARCGADRRPGGGAGAARTTRPRRWPTGS